MNINFFKTKKDFKKKSSELNPGFYWKFIVCLAVALTTISFIFGYYMFLSVRDEPASEFENFTKRQPIEKERLEKVLDNFSLREKKSALILNSPSKVVDPSL
ncbi:MAG TPA: hypothetical protein VGO63_03145 [Candidatus Paceibacterota bacterium]|jgi:hypothetical protein|nr:hypothetical protein [Candidatus Paceibacterota bacterium]